MLREALARARGKRDMAANDLLVEAGEVESDGQQWTLGSQRLRLRLKGGLNDPLRRIGFVSALVGSCKADVVAVDELKE